MEAKIEEAVIGSLILNPKQFSEVSEIISGDDFKIDLYRHAFMTIKRMIESNTDVDLTGVYFEMGRPTEASSLSKSIEECFLDPTYYARILKKRNLEDEIKKTIKNREYDETQKRIKEYGDIGQPVDLYSIQKMIETDIRFKESFKTGFKDLDYYLTLCPMDLMVIAGRPSSGKTSFGLSVLFNLAKETPVGLVSFEMGMNKIGKRLATMYTFEQINNIHKNFIASSPSVFTLAETRKSIKSFISSIGAKVIMVDYLQLMKDVKPESRRLEVTNIIRGLKEIAKEFGIVVIVVSSLSRGADHSENSRPTMNMLRESGDIEYAADVIFFLHRPSKDGELTEGILDKNRDGKAKKIVNLVWLEDQVRFGNYAYKEILRDSF